MIIQGNTALDIVQVPHEYRVIEGAVTINDKCEIKLTAKQEKEFTEIFKTGILKQLHQKSLLTDEQLIRLIKMQNK